MNKLIRPLLALLGSVLLLSGCTPQPTGDTYGYTTVNMGSGLTVTPKQQTWIIDGTQVNHTVNDNGQISESSYQLADREAFEKVLHAVFTRPTWPPPCDDAPEMTIQTLEDEQTRAAHLEYCGPDDALIDAVLDALEPPA